MQSHLGHIGSPGNPTKDHGALRIFLTLLLPMDEAANHGSGMICPCSELTSGNRSWLTNVIFMRNWLRKMANPSEGFGSMLPEATTLIVIRRFVKGPGQPFISATVVCVDKVANSITLSTFLWQSNLAMHTSHVFITRHNSTTGLFFVCPSHPHFLRDVCEPSKLAMLGLRIWYHLCHVSTHV